MNACLKIFLLCGFSAAAMFAAGNEMLSVRAEGDVKLDTNPDSPFWKGARPVVADLNNFGKQVPGHSTEVRSRWTAGNLYFLFICPYQQLHLKPNPVTKTETNELWNWDVAEVFIGADFKNIKRYREFEVSPQSEWVDLDIDRASKHPEDGWIWNSGFKVATRIDFATKVWYAAMRIPWAAIDSHAVKAGATFRMNLYRSQGPPGHHVAITWQPTMKETFHVPERFGLLKLE